MAPSVWPWVRDNPSQPSSSDYVPLTEPGQMTGHLDGLQPARHSLLRSLVRRASRIDPTADQRTIIIVACVYIVVIAVLWNVPYLKIVLYPFKLIVVGLHEASHAIMGVLTGAKIESIKLEPNEGGATRMRGGIPWLTLPAGYIGSSLFGAAMIACAFDIRASKIMTIILGVVFLITICWARRDWLVWILLLGMAGIIVAFWFIAHGVALQFFVLFFGVMSCMYSVWDIIEDLIIRKVEESDASAFSRLVGGPPQLWGVLWFLISVVAFAAGLIIGIVAFKTPLAQQQQDDFLDTRATRRAAFDDFVVLRPR